MTSSCNKFDFHKIVLCIDWEFIAWLDFWHNTNLVVTLWFRCDENDWCHDVWLKVINTPPSVNVTPSSVIVMRRRNHWYWRNHRVADVRNYPDIVCNLLSHVLCCTCDLCDTIVRRVNAVVVDDPVPIWRLGMSSASNMVTQVIIFKRNTHDLWSLLRIAYNVS